MVMAKVTFSQALAGATGGGAAYLGIFYSSPGKYSLCVPVADTDFYNSYKAWYDAHRRPISPEAWMTNNTRLILPKLPELPEPPLHDYQYDDHQPARVKRMLVAKNKASVTRTKSVPTVSSVTSEFTEDTSTSQVPTLSTDLSDAAPTWPNDAEPPQAVHAGPIRLAGTGTTPPPAAVLRYDVKSADGGDHSTESAPADSVAPEILPTTETPFTWVTDYTAQIKTAAIWGLIMTNIMTLAYLVGYKAAGRKTRWKYSSPSSARSPPHHDVRVNLVGQPARYDRVDLEDRGLAAYADDGAYEIPNQPDLPSPPRSVI